MLLVSRVVNGNCDGTSKQTVGDQASKGLVVMLDIGLEGVKLMKASPGIDARYALSNQ